MKKFGLGIVTLLIFCLVFVANVLADTVIESPKVKIIIDGQIGKYEDVPIIVNGRTMLPLREVLVNLGVENDDQHIIWDGVKKSVTVKKDSKTIYLEAGSKTASVDGKDITLDVEPMVYVKNNRTYIPARFVAESLGKKVIWDGSTTSVLIRDDDKFNDIKSILDKSQASMEKLEKYKCDMKAEINSDGPEQKVKVSNDTAVQLDLENKSMYMKMNIDMGEIEGFKLDVGTEVYQKDNVTYTKNILLGDSWIKLPISEEESLNSIRDNSNADIIEVNDVLCAGLVATEAGNEIILKGDVYIDELFQKGLSSSDSAAAGENSQVKYELEKFSMQISLDKDTYRVNSMKLLFEASVEDANGKPISINMIMEVKYSGYDGNFEIEVPEEVIKNAIDPSSLFSDQLFQ
ncbi:MAG: copper amine oxidase N-terminal domain-containing protein [Clostridiaceae bacterium]|nr:copper amine oxidase N-terminal domain-containing protein [Clostridiaceae bacterium]